MKRVGNTTSNRTFNPKNVRPQIPADVDEADGVMERFIRQKYEKKAFVSGVKPAQVRKGSVSSDDQPPPPLPPKPGKKFGFGLRSTSTTLAKPERHTPPLSPAYTGSNGSSSPVRTNKQSRVLGSNVGNPEDAFDSKLATLRDMGFKDSRRNSTILKSMNGNLDRTVEALVRNGETNKPPSGTITPVSSEGAPNGITVEKRRPNDGAPSAFEQLDMQHAQRSFSTPQPTLQHAQNPGLSYYAASATIPQSQPLQYDPNMIAQQMGTLNISQYQQATPGAVNTSTGQNPFLPQSQGSFAPAPQVNGFVQPQVQQQAPAFSQLPQSSDTTQSNPFLRRVQSQTFLQPNPLGQQLIPQRSPSPATNPWQVQPSLPLGPSQLSSQPTTPSVNAQPQNGFFASPASTPTYQYVNNPFQPAPSNASQSAGPATGFQQPFLASPASDQSPHTISSQSYGMPQQTYPVQQQAGPQSYLPAQHPTYPPPTQQTSPFQASPFKHDKSSILALYNQPHLAPQPTGQVPVQGQPSMNQGQVPQRSATMPVSTGSMNPFAVQNPQPNSAGYANGHMGQPQQQHSYGQDAFSGLLPERWH